MPAGLRSVLQGALCRASQILCGAMLGSDLASGIFCILRLFEWLMGVKFDEFLENSALLNLVSPSQFGWSLKTSFSTRPCPETFSLDCQHLILA